MTKQIQELTAHDEESFSQGSLLDPAFLSQVLPDLRMASEELRVADYAKFVKLARRLDWLSDVIVDELTAQSPDLVPPIVEDIPGAKMIFRN